MGDKEDYLTSYRVFFENFAATVNPEDQLPVNIAGYTITETELPGEVLYWMTQYLTEKQCPLTLMTPLRRIILDEVRVASKKSPNEFGYKADESVYIALRLMQAVTARVNAICLRYLDNSMLDSLPPPPPPEQWDMKTVSCATKNSRRVMEDRHVEIGNLESLFGIETTESTSFYAVYDGHAGSAAATYCAAHLHQYLVESPHFKDDLRRAMRDAFLRTDAEFVRKSNQERACGGSTAVAVVVRGRRLLAAWAGDSLALLAKRMRLMQLVQPHKPGRQDERARIESSGGTVMYWGTWRVNGQLAVSRAIGDAQYKPYVTARPETATVDLDGDEDFVVVACDGLWDFVSEDDVALSVYRQIAADPDDLKAVTKRLIEQAKRQGSVDNISIIVVFLKEPRQIAADNRPPMDLGLDNALPNAPPFGMEAEACKRQLDAVGRGEAEGGECADAEPDNGVDNSDSDSEDLGPETAVDVDADDVDADARNHHPEPPTPPADTLEEGHVDGAVVDNVAESGEESEDEWNYFKGEGEREEANPSDEPEDPLRSETPCQDNSAWESSSVDMNSSPLNPDAPVFVPGSVAGGDVLLAESPRKPLPMDDIELPDVAQFETGAVVRPAELVDLDNCDQLNGHHNLLDESIKEQLNGNNKYNMDSLGFGFSVGTEPEKGTDGLIQDFERIQKDTTDFCNIQVFQAHAETNPFASDENDELLERLKNKERDPMSMSFYQEKDDDTCERLASKNESHVDLNAVQPLPDSDDEDIQPNGVCETENDKENISPEQHNDLLGPENDIQEPNNDIIRFDDRKDVLANNPLNFGQGDNFMDYNGGGSSNNMQAYSNNEFDSSNAAQDSVAHTDTPESHKLLFEQIPEIPDGKSSELGFTTEDLLDQTESEKDARVVTPQEEMSQDVDMESKNDDSPCIEDHPEISESQESHIQSDLICNTEQVQSESQLAEDKENEIIPESEFSDNIQNAFSTERLPASPLPVEDRLAEVISPEVPHDVHDNVKVDIHQSAEQNFDADFDTEVPQEVYNPDNFTHETPDIRIDSEELATDAEIDRACSLPLESSVPAESPLPSHSPLPSESPLPSQSPLPSESPLPVHDAPPTASPAPAKSPLPADSPAPPKSPLQADTQESLSAESPAPSKSPLLGESPAPPRSPTPAESPVPLESPLPVESPAPKSPAPEVAADTLEPCTEALTETTPEPPAQSPLPADVPLPRESPPPAESPMPVESPLPAEAALPVESPLPAESPVVMERSLPVEASIPSDAPPAIDEPASPSPAPAPASPSPAPAEPLVEAPATADRFSPEVAQEAFETTPAAAGPAPDIVPDEPAPRSGLVTDIDIGVPESRAQEICVPVTSEIQLDDAVQAAATPPPTPAVDAAPAAPLSETPIAADVAPVAAAAVAGAAVAAAAAAAAKPKTPATKKSPTTPTAAARATPKTATRTSAAPSPRTPASAKKPAAPAAPAARPASGARLSAPAARAAAPTAKTLAAPRTSAAKPAAPGPRAAPKTSPAPAREPPATARAAPTGARAPAARAAPAPRAAAPRPATAPARPAPRPAPAAAKPPAARPAPAAAPAPRPPPITRPKDPKPKAPIEKKPLANGDAKDAAKPPPRAPAARPAARPAPRAPPRATPAAAPAPPKSTAAPKAAPRVPAARPLDKQTKDLANKRITAKAAPPRTAATKAPPGTKSSPSKVVKKSLDAGHKLPATNGLSNGADELRKPPPSPPLDNALLPDVIA